MMIIIFGSLGTPGNDGRPGEQGDTGSQGPTGTDGEDGPTGPAGRAGPKGAQGPTGADGNDGEDGKPGEQGADGETGPIGPTGAAGPTGARGRNGTEYVHCLKCVEWFENSYSVTVARLYSVVRPWLWRGDHVVISCHQDSHRLRESEWTELSSSSSNYVKKIELLQYFSEKSEGVIEKCCFTRC